MGVPVWVSSRWVSDLGECIMSRSKITDGEFNMAYDEAYQQVNQQAITRDYIGTHTGGLKPEDPWEFDFTEVKPGLGAYQY